MGEHPLQPIQACDISEGSQHGNKMDVIRCGVARAVRLTTGANSAVVVSQLELQATEGCITARLWDCGNISSMAVSCGKQSWRAFYPHIG